VKVEEQKLNQIELEFQRLGSSHIDAKKFPKNRKFNFEFQGLDKSHIDAKKFPKNQKLN
jgi:hypothetical protein